MDKVKGAIFIMPRSSKAWVGAEALWVTAAGWSAAAKRKFGDAWVVTSDRIAPPEDVVHYPLTTMPVDPKKKRRLHWIPDGIATIAKDLLLWRQSRNWNILDEPPWAGETVAFVWQQHDLFSGPGRRLASELKVPLVTYVHAPVVWESAKWGVKRYAWGSFLERYVEARALKQSDIVACVSQDVADKLAQMGVDNRRILISPMAVDPYLFGQTKHEASLRTELGLTNKIVIGWTGSFRTFHGLDLLVKAFNNIHKENPESRLLLVGDGRERAGIENLVDALGLTDAVIFAGRQPFAAIPRFISVFDVAVVSTRTAQGFHYSPLKLREYLVAGKPAIAPHAGEIPAAFVDGKEVLLYTAGDEKDMYLKIKALLNDNTLRGLLSKSGREKILNNGTWDFELQKLVQALDQM